MAETTTPITWKTIQQMMKDFAQDLHSKFTCRPCTSVMIEEWILLTMTMAYSPGDYCAIECQCEDMWECPHVINDEGFQELFQAGLNKLAKVIVTNMFALNHGGPDETFPLSVREEILGHAYYRYGPGWDSDEEEEDDEGDYEMDDEQMYANAYGSMYGPGFVY